MIRLGERPTGGEHTDDERPWPGVSREAATPGGDRGGERGETSPSSVGCAAGVADIEHVGSAHTDADLEARRAVARQRLAAGQDGLGLRLPNSPANQGAALPITSSRMGHLLDALSRGYDALGFSGW